MFNIKVFSVLVFILLLSILGNKMQYDKLYDLSKTIEQLEKDKQGLDKTISDLRVVIDESKESCKANIAQAIQLHKLNYKLTCTSYNLNEKIDLIGEKERQIQDKGGAYVREIDKGSRIETAPRLAKLDDVIPDCGELCRVLDEAYRAAKGSD